jgi:NAD(P)-dependent dehydrogenase (short-subunit alcohol dehydrogenase family)
LPVGILQVALKTRGVRVNCICPSFVDTPMLDKQKEEMPIIKAIVDHMGIVK